MLRTISFIVLISTFFVSGCSTLADAQAAKGQGTSKIYNKDYETVWLATKEVVSNSGLALVTENKEKGTILAQRAMTAFSYGENVAIFVESEKEQNKTKVEVVNKRALATNITAANWETTLIRALDQKLK
jgi:ribosomal protein L21E